MELTPASTFKEVTDAYEANLSYARHNSIEECNDFIQAAKFYKRRVSDKSASGTSSVEDSPEKLQKEIDEANAWLGVNDPAAATTARPAKVRHVGFTGFWS